MDSEAAILWFLQSPSGWTLAAIWGALWGSFANVCIHRIPLRQSLVQPGSHCPSCQQPIAWYHNVPILGYLLVRGRCRSCGARVSPRYLVVELLAIALTLLVYARFVAPGDAPPSVELSRFIVYFFFVGVLLVMSAIDVEHQILPDRISYPAIPLFFLLGRLLFWMGGEVSLWQAVGGLVAGYLIVRLISDGYYYLTGREGLGYGDGKLLSLIGGLLGWKALPWVLLVGSVSGLIVGAPLTLWLRRKSDEQAAMRHTAVVFGPFLSFGALCYLLLLLGRDIDSLLLKVLAPLLGNTV